MYPGMEELAHVELACLVKWQQTHVLTEEVRRAPFHLHGESTTTCLALMQVAKSG